MHDMPLMSTVSGIFWKLRRTEELAKLQKQSDWKLKILERLDRMIKKYGIIRLIEKGVGN